MKIEQGVRLARMTTFGAGGPSSGFAKPESVAELREALQWATEQGLGVEPIGLGSNVLAADGGVDALVVRLDGELAAISIDGTTMRAGGGASNAVCLRRAREAALGGLEFACAIPGTVGGGVRMNAGAYGSAFGDVLTRALVVSADEERWLDRAELGLRYRNSDLAPGQVVALAELALTSRPEAEIRATVKEMQAHRKAAQPTNKRTFGSVFKNPDHELTAGRMLEQCGLRGHRIGGAQISPMHANFIENVADATAVDALALIEEARRRAREQFGVELEPEVRLLGDIAVL